MNFVVTLAQNLILCLFLSGFLLAWFLKQRNALKKQFLYGAALFAWLLSTQVVSDLFINPLENQYQAPSILFLQEQSVEQVVVLTGGGYPRRGLLATSALTYSSALRFVSGLELCGRLSEQCRVIFSGSAGRGNEQDAVAITMQELSIILNSERVVSAEVESDNTAQHPENVKPLLAPNEPFVLVTSAMHMPRAVQAFQEADLSPIPYPVGHLSSVHPYQWSNWLPSAQNLWSLNTAWREYLATVQYALR